MRSSRIAPAENPAEDGEEEEEEEEEMEEEEEESGEVSLGAAQWEEGSGATAEKGEESVEDEEDSRPEVDDDDERAQRSSGDGTAGAAPSSVSVAYRSSLLRTLEGRRLQSVITAGATLTKLDLSDNRIAELPLSLVTSIVSLRTLLLHENDFVAIPELLSTCTALQRLDVSCNTLEWRSLKRLKPLRALRSLALEDCGLTDLPREIGTLTTLEVLLLGSNKLGSRSIGACPRAIAALGKKLRVLRLDDNPKLTKANVKTLNHLTRLSICGAGLKTLPGGIQRLTKLTVLALSRNRIGKITARDLGALKLLESVDLSFNPELRLRKGETMANLIMSWPKLQSLHLDTTQIGTLATGVNVSKRQRRRSETALAGDEHNWDTKDAADAPSLQLEAGDATTLPSSTWSALAFWPRTLQLMIRNNKIEEFPPPAEEEEVESKSKKKKKVKKKKKPSAGGIFGKRASSTGGPKGGGLMALRDVRLSRMPLRRLAPTIGKLVGLQRLTISGHLLTTLPPSIELLQMLTTLTVTDGTLRVIPPEIGALRNLKKLSLAGNELRSLPNEFCDLCSLTSLKLDHNKIRLLPAMFGNLTALEHLDIDANKMIEVPESIGEIVALRELFLGFNFLKTLPDSIGALGRTLHVLILDHNRLETLPMSCKELTNVELHLEANPDLGRIADRSRYDAAAVEEDVTEKTQSEALGALLGFSLAGTETKQKKEARPQTEAEIVGDVLTSLFDHDCKIFMQKPLVNLFALDLSNKGISAKLTIIPKYVFALASSLRELLLSSNALAELPKEIGQCTALRKLWLNSNKLATLPRDIVHCSKLQELSLWNNPIIELPQRLAEIPDLKELHLDPMVVISENPSVCKTIALLRAHGCKLA